VVFIISNRDYDVSRIIAFSHPKSLFAPIIYGLLCTTGYSKQLHHKILTLIKHLNNNHSLIFNPINKIIVVRKQIPVTIITIIYPGYIYSAFLILSRHLYTICNGCKDFFCFLFSILCDKLLLELQQFSFDKLRIYNFLLRLNPQLFPKLFGGQCAFLSNRLFTLLHFNLKFV